MPYAHFPYIPISGRVTVGAIAPTIFGETPIVTKICNYNPVNFLFIRRCGCCRNCCCCHFFVVFWRFCRFQTGATFPFFVKKFRPIRIVDNTCAITPMTKTVFVASPNAFAKYFHFSFHQRINICRISARNCARTKSIFACFAFFLKKKIKLKI